eukprot:7384884-Prymnesium_polylepis.3
MPDVARVRSVGVGDLLVLPDAVLGGGGVGAPVGVGGGDLGRHVRQRRRSVALQSSTSLSTKHRAGV